MRMLALILAAFGLAPSAEAQTAPARTTVTSPEVQYVAPALRAYTDDVLFGDVWRRSELSPRDRSFVTISALVAGDHTQQMRGHFNRALDNGVKPSEISGIITHLAFYAGWPRAMSAVTVAKEVFTQRGLSPIPEPGLQPPVNDPAEAQRAASVEAQVNGVAPALSGYTNGVLFQDLWRRTDLSARDRSLATVTALIAGGQAEQLPFHLNRGMDAGLTQVQVGEVITHLAFYAGWPRAMSAVSVADTVFKSRERGSSGD